MHPDMRTHFQSYNDPQDEPLNAFDQGEQEPADERADYDDADHCDRTRDR